MNLLCHVATKPLIAIASEYTDGSSVGSASESCVGGRRMLCASMTSPVPEVKDQNQNPCGSFTSSRNLPVENNERAANHFGCERSDHLRRAYAHCFRLALVSSTSEERPAIAVCDPVRRLDDHDLDIA